MAIHKVLGRIWFATSKGELASPVDWLKTFGYRKSDNDRETLKLDGKKA